MSDVEFVMKEFDITKEKAERLIAGGLNVPFLRHGFDEFMNKNFHVDDKIAEFKRRLDESVAKDRKNSH